MRVLQILPTISYGDGVSNDCIAIKSIFEKEGYRTAIYAENIDQRLSEKNIYSIKKLPKLYKDDIVLYHLSTGTPLNRMILELNGKKIIRYHNITPPEFFEGYSASLNDLCRQGYDEAKEIAQRSRYVLADSEYNRKEMIRMGFKGDSKVAPILIPFDDYKKTASEKVISEYRNFSGKNIVFVGRLAPNKKQERIIEIFNYYKKYFDSNARLFLVGSGNGLELYEKRLKQYAEFLELKDVYFTGHINFDEILAYYQLADTFVCMSEHEGFCIPLVEAMYFDKPIVALDTSAVGETLNGSGILLKEYKPIEAAGIIHKVNTDVLLRNIVVENQRERLKDFDTETVAKTILEYIQKVEKEK